MYRNYAQPLFHRKYVSYPLVGLFRRGESSIYTRTGTIDNAPVVRIHIRRGNISGLQPNFANQGLTERRRAVAKE